MSFFSLMVRRLSWRWLAAAIIFLCALVSLLFGVGLSERTDLASSHLLTKAYYSLGLFVFGGLDVGVPDGGPPLARAMLWIAYFCAPLLTASAVIDAVFRAFSPQRWLLRRLHDHYIVNGTGRLTLSYLQELRRRHPKATVVVIEKDISRARRLELEQAFNVRVVSGDLSTEFMIRQLRTKRAKRIALLAVDDFHCYEAASQILNLYPEMGERILLHCSNLRFSRAMENTSIAQKCVTFNSYLFASVCLVRDELQKHFVKTAQRDVVVLGGYGRFGQTILEELNESALSELATVVLIDKDADRRVLVAEEQRRLNPSLQRITLQGDVAHPQVWSSVSDEVDLSVGEPVVILGTGDASNNLRTALWVKEQFPKALVFARTNYHSRFAQEVSSDYDLKLISVLETVEQNMPESWLD